MESLRGYCSYSSQTRAVRLRKNMIQKKVEMETKFSIDEIGDGKKPIFK
jgi:hypothetical protein